MSGSRKRILSPFNGRKKQKTGNKTREKYMPERNIQNLAKTDKGSYYNQEEWLEEFLDDKGAIYNGTEAATGGVLLQKVFLKIWQISQKNTCVGISSYKICEIFKNTYFVEHLRTTASDGS